VSKSVPSRLERNFLMPKWAAHPAALWRSQIPSPSTRQRAHLSSAAGATESLRKVDANLGSSTSLSNRLCRYSIACSGHRFKTSRQNDAAQREQNFQASPRRDPDQPSFLPAHSMAPDTRRLWIASAGINLGPEQDVHPYTLWIVPVSAH